MTDRPRVRVLCMPDVQRPIGGVKQLYRQVEHLVDLGWDAAMVSEAPGFRPAWFASDAPVLALAECQARGELSPESTILLLPETYLEADLAAFRGLNLSGLARVVFNQNAYYSYGQLGPHTTGALQRFYDHPAVLQVLSVSADTHIFLRRNLGLADGRLSRIINAIEPQFAPQQPKANRMHWMPRKNADHVQAVLQGLQRCGLQHSGGWQAEPLEGLSHAVVATQLNGARLFLSFGHPEGFGLPIAEAMAAGCWVVGYSGGGGRELFGFGASEDVSFGDWPGFIDAIQRAFTVFATEPRHTALLLEQQALAVRTLYSSERERASIAVAWERIAQAFSQWRAAACV